MRLRTLTSGLAVMAALVAAALVIEYGLLEHWLSEEWIDREVRDHGIVGELIYLGIVAIATALAFPRQVVSFLGGYAFGVGLGSVLALVGTEIGCALSFFYARAFGRPLVGVRLAARARRVEIFLADSPLLMTLLIRLLPVGNNFLTNIVAGVARVAAPPFLVGSLLGYVPQTLVFALAGSGVDLGATMRIVIAASLLVVSGVIGVRLYHRFRHGRSLGVEVDEALEEDRHAVDGVKPR